MLLLGEWIVNSDDLFGSFQIADADSYGGYDGDGQQEHEHLSGNRNRVGVHVEMVGRGSGVAV